MRRPDEIDTYDLVRHLRLERQRKAEADHKQAQRMGTIVAVVLLSAMALVLALGAL